MFQLGTRFWFIGTIRHEINVFNLQPWTCASASTLLWMEYHSFYSPGLDFSLFLFLLLCALYPGTEESKEQLITHNINQFCQGIWHALCYYHRKYPYLPTDLWFNPPPPFPTSHQSLLKDLFWFIVSFKFLWLLRLLSPLEFPTYPPKDKQARIFSGTMYWQNDFCSYPSTVLLYNVNLYM